MMTVQPQVVQGADGQMYYVSGYDAGQNQLVGMPVQAIP